MLEGAIKESLQTLKMPFFLFFFFFREREEPRAMLELKVLPAERFVLILCLLTTASCFSVYIVKFLVGREKLKSEKELKYNSLCLQRA